MKKKKRKRRIWRIGGKLVFRLQHRIDWKWKREEATQILYNVDWKSDEERTRGKGEGSGWRKANMWATRGLEEE